MEIKTKRLFMRRLMEHDRENYFDMMSNPNVMNPIPAKVMSRAESDAHFNTHFNFDFPIDDKILLAVIDQKTDTFIGIGAYLTNDDGDPEIGYRLREKFWNQGYGTEIAYVLLEHGFNNMNFELITADVSIENKLSLKILEKFMRLSHEFWSEKYQTFDRRYVLSFGEWEKSKLTLPY